MDLLEILLPWLELDLLGALLHKGFVDGGGGGGGIFFGVVLKVRRALGLGGKGDDGIFHF